MFHDPGTCLLYTSHGGRHIAGIVVRGNADVLVVEFQRERMLRLAQAAVDVYKRQGRPSAG